MMMGRPVRGFGGDHRRVSIRIVHACGHHRCFFTRLPYCAKYRFAFCFILHKNSVLMHSRCCTSSEVRNRDCIAREGSMSKRYLLAVLLGLSVFSIGCGAGMAVTARQQEAFVVRAGLFKHFVYRCTAQDPTNPVCVRVNERR